MKEKYYINEKTHLATEKIFVLHHSLKINKRGVGGRGERGGGPNKLLGEGEGHLRVINLALIPPDQNLAISFFSNLLRTIEIP